MTTQVISRLPCHRFMKVEFDSAVHADLVLRGFLFVVLVPDGDHFNAVPLRNPVESEKIDFLGYVQFEISALQIQELIATLRRKEGARIFIDSKYLESSR